MLFESLLTASATKTGYVVALYISGIGTILIFFMAMVIKHLAETGIGRFEVFKASRHSHGPHGTTEQDKIGLYTPYAAFGLVAFSLFTLFNGMRCFRDKDKRRKSVWYWYLYFKGFLILGMFGIGIYALTESARGDELRKILKDTMDHYEHHDHDREVKITWDFVQKRYDCCGVDTYSDWQEVAFGAFLLATPQSCCLYGTRHNRDCGLNVLPKYEFAYKHVNTKGCFEILFGSTRLNLILLGILMILLGFIHIITLMSSFLLANVSGVQERAQETKELHELHKMYEPDTSTRNKIYRQHLYMDHGYGD